MNKNELASLSALSNLGVTPAGEFAWPFDPSTNLLVMSVNETVTNVSVLPVPVDSTTTVIVGGKPVDAGDLSDPIPLTEGDNVVLILCVAQDGVTVSNYLLQITRQILRAYVAALAGLEASGGALYPAFNTSIYSYSMNLGFANASIAISPTVVDNNTIVSINDQVLGSDNSSGLVILGIGSNQITITVSTPDGLASVSYTMIIIRAKPYLPSLLRYRRNPVFALISHPQANNNVTEQGEGAMNYTITPSLPAGLVFSSTDGSISGVATEATPLTTYFITATNPSGSINSTIQLATELRMFLFIYLIFIYLFI